MSYKAGEGIDEVKETTKTRQSMPNKETGLTDPQIFGHGNAQTDGCQIQKRKTIFLLKTRQQVPWAQECVFFFLSYDISLLNK